MNQESSAFGRKGVNDDRDPVPAPDAVVQIARDALWADVTGMTTEEARAVVAALARAGWLHDPAEVAARRAVERRAQEVANSPNTFQFRERDAARYILAAAPTPED